MRAVDEKLISITITDRYTQSSFKYESEVEPYIVELMLKTNYVTIKGKTIKTNSSRVDDSGKVYFYGDAIEEEHIT